MKSIYSVFCAILILIFISCNTADNTAQTVGMLQAQQQITDVVNKLFVYTDQQDWDQLQAEVFADTVLFDMVSAGAERAETKTSLEICKLWKKGFEGLDAIHHQAGNYIIHIEHNSAVVKAYAIASHYKQSAKNGPLRKFVGSYDIGLTEYPGGWRINRFKYNLKYMDGNLELE